MADRIIEDLEDLAAHLDWPDPPDLSSVVRVRIAESNIRTVARAREREPRRWIAVGVAAALLIAAVLVIPGPRRAIARFFGIEGVRITGTDTDSPALPATVTNGLRLGERAPLDDVVDQASFPVMAPIDLRTPNAAFRGEPSPEAVTLVWAPSDRLPPTGPAGGVGLLLTQFPGRIERPLLDKQIGPDAVVEATMVDDRPAYWITGAAHLLIYLDADGQRRDDTVRLAANTLLWSNAGVTYRLESALDRDAAIALAASLEALR